jgi:hypothetical protein
MWTGAARRNPSQQAGRHDGFRHRPTHPIGYDLPMESACKPDINADISTPKRAGFI